MFLCYFFSNIKYAQLNKMYNLLTEMKLRATCQSHKNIETKIATGNFLRCRQSPFKFLKLDLVRYLGNRRK